MTNKTHRLWLRFLLAGTFLWFLVVDLSATEIADDLVCHLTFDGDTRDHSGSSQANDGRAMGDPGFTEGRIGRAIVLQAGAGQCVNLGRPEELRFGDRESGHDFSVSLWCRIDASETWPVLITNKDYSSKPSGNSVSHTGWGIFLHTDKKLRWNCKDDSSEALFVEHVGPVLADGAWHHVTVTHNRKGRAVAYVDGRCVGSIYMATLKSTIDAGLPTVIGNDGVFGMAAWDGAVDDVGIWRRILSPAEVWSIYSSGLEGKALSAARPLAALFDSNVVCRWIPDAPEPTLSVTVTNSGAAPCKVNGWRLTGADAAAFKLKGSPTLALQPGESAEARIAWDRSEPDERDLEASLEFDHDATNLDGVFSVNLARQVKRAPYRYRLDHFEERMKQPVVRDEQGRIVVNDGYHDDLMIQRLLKAFNEDYRALTRLEQIGTTWQERPIWALKICGDPTLETDKPAFLFVAAHHGNELLSMEFVLDMIHVLTTRYETDAKVRKWVDSAEIWCIPLANPDGCHRFFHTVAAGRKNGRDNNGNGLDDYSDGVDINRNYPFHWHSLGEEGSKSDPSAGWYRGPEPASEPEVRAIMALADRERFVAAISYHTAGTKILVPYTIDNCRSPRPNTAWVLAGHLAALADSGREDRDYLPVRNLYSVDGTDQDWHYWRHGTLAYIWEGPRTNPPYGDRDRFVFGVRPGWQFLLERLIQGPAVSGHIRDAATGRPFEATISLEEIKTFEGETHTSHPVTGRFDRILPRAGEYHLKVRKEGYETASVRVEVGKEWKAIEVNLVPDGSGAGER